MGTVNANIISEDLENILAQTNHLWESARGEKFFITGGTGFLGKWLLESLVYINQRLNLDIQATVLTRNISNFKEAAPHFQNCGFINFYEGDVRYFSFFQEKFNFIIHAATETTPQTSIADALEVFDVCVNGTKRVLEFAVKSKAKQLLLISSGAVYGTQPPSMSNIDENYLGGPDVMNYKGSYGEGKRVSELLCGLYSNKYGFESKIARCFAFVGPYLPLDSHFAVGNFIKDVLNNGPLIIKGDGNSYRSYLYTSDLMVWLWTILFKGVQNRPYNVGSSSDMKISEIASRVANLSEKKLEIKLLNENKYLLETNRYIPSVERAQKELGLVQSVDVNDAISRTLLWNKSIRQNSTESRKLI